VIGQEPIAVVWGAAEHDLKDVEVIALARRLLEADRIDFNTVHGRQRQVGRGVHHSDIRSAIITAGSAEFDAARDTWRLFGWDYEGTCRIDVVLAFKDENSRARLVTTIRIEKR
jgi:hypothetical protein